MQVFVTFFVILLSEFSNNEPSMKKTSLLFLSVLALAVMTLAGGCKRYETVSGDPLQTKIYTLDNGLKVYMTVNREKPRIQTYIAVHAGGYDKDDAGYFIMLFTILLYGEEDTLCYGDSLYIKSVDRDTTVLMTAPCSQRIIREKHYKVITDDRD